MPFRAPGQHALTGSVETRSIAYAGRRTARDRRAEQWTRLSVRYSGRFDAVRVTAAVRAEHSTSPRLGDVTFDPADRQPRRSPLSLRELGVTFPLASGIDLEVGRFPVAWGQTDGYSPADGFLPRDATDPLTEDRLPLWGARLSGERRGIRVELLVAPTTTPWRLPTMDGRHSPLSNANVFLLDLESPVPRRGFGSLRVSAVVRGWDVGGWVRSGVRPAPILVPRQDLSEERPDGRFVPIARRYADETGYGVEIGRAVGGWVVRGELGLLRSDDPDLGNAAIWSFGGSRSVRDGTLTATVAMNVVDPPVVPLLLLDRAFLPAVIFAIHQNESWGAWDVGWLGTFEWVGGVFTLELTRDLSDALKLIAGADLPHGAVLSPARAFAGSKRARVGLRFSW
jgi:hypothetical protein